MRFDERLLDCIVFIGRDDSGEFVSHGTGFLAAKGTGGYFFQHIVTAGHVIRGIKHHEVCVRINQLDGTVSHEHWPKNGWEFHPDKAVDLAVAPASVPKDEFSIGHVHLDKHVLTLDAIKEHRIGVGDDVVTAGMFTRHIHHTTNRPIVRAGIISAMADAPVETSRGFVHAYLVEVRSIAGLSGSPVFVQMAPIRIVPDDSGGGSVVATRGHFWYFMGVMLGHHVTSDPNEVVSPDPYSPADMNAGLGVVVPWERLLELVETPKLKEQRERIVAKKREEVKFVEDSATGAEPPTTADNLSHREDFSRLLTSVTTGKPRDDQT